MRQASKIGEVCFEDTEQFASRQLNATGLLAHCRKISLESRTGKPILVLLRNAETDKYIACANVDSNARTVTADVVAQVRCFSNTKARHIQGYLCRKMSEI